MLLVDAINEFLLAMEADGLRRATIVAYRSHLIKNKISMYNWLINHDITQVHQVSTKHLRQFVVDLRSHISERSGNQLSPTTIDDFIRAIHRFWGWCFHEYALPNPARGISYPKINAKKPKAVGMDDVVAILNTLGDDVMSIRDRAIIYFLLDTGCRAGGICGLTIEELDLENRRAFVNEKGDKTRFVFFSETTEAVLRQWLEVRTPMASLFYNIRHFTPLTTSGLLQMLTRRGRDAKVTGRVNPHSFRHAFAREWLMQGGDLATLSKMLGHAQIQTTISNYIYFSDKDMREKHEEYSPVKYLK